MSFQSWFEQREVNGALRCDNIYDALSQLVGQEELYDFLESMMLAAWCAGVEQGKN